MWEEGPMSTATPDAPPEDWQARARRLLGRRTTVGPGTAASAVAADLSELIRAEVALAQAELQAGIRPKAMGAGLFAAAGVAGWLGLQGLLITLGFVLAIWLPAWAAALIVTGLLLLVAGIAALAGRAQLKKPFGLDTTKANIEEDVAWARQHLRGR
jgi:hypothetical protein